MQQATNTVDPICMTESEKPIIQPQIQAPPPYKSSNLQPFDKIIDKQEDKSTKQRPQKGIIKLTAAVTLISLSSFYYGFVLTYLSTIPKSTLVKYYGDVINQTSTLPIISGAMPIGAIFGSLLANVLMRFFTRRNFLLFVSLIAIAINLIIQITNIWVLLFCRFITGILVGLFLGIVPAYINEITPSKMLGTMGAFTQMQHLLGNVISYLFGTIFYLSNFEGDFMMRFQFQFTSFLILLQFIGIGFGIVPQSPNSLLLAGRYQEAKQVLSQFNYEDEIDGIINEKLFENGQNQKKPSYSEAPPEQSNQNSPLHIQSLPLNKIDDSQPKMTWKSYLLSFQLPLTQQLTGVNFIVTQVTAITALYDEKLSHFTGLIANAVQLIATSFSTILLSSFGRRPIIIVGNICVGILTLIIGVVFLLLYYGWQPGFGLGMGLIMLFNVVYGLTLGPIVWLYVPEIASKKIVPIATATYWGGCSFSLIVAPIITSIMQSPYAVFFFFGGYTTAMILPNWKLVVQTKGLTSSQISKKFKTN